ncbi:hypothetical protein [Kitasatospora terrestris]|uniref:Uncharacterized protein n=1 Tax=Kitasatospora terrestris TaxID=258051 RepID=A0ABP9DIZ4_9ACTN
MTLNIRFVAIAALGSLLVAGVATAAELNGADRPAVVVTADGTTAGGPVEAGALPNGPLPGTGTPANVEASPSPSVSHQDTWGWG